MTTRPLSRRQLLRQVFAQVDDDERLVGEALLLERVVVASYDVAVEASRSVPPRARRVRGRPPLPELLRRLRSQEREHVEVLASKLQELGGRPVVVPEDVASLARVRREVGLRLPFDDLVSERAIAAFALELEDAQTAAYLGAVRDFRDARLVELAVQIMGAEGQHAVVLRSLLGDAAALLVPDAFERGEGGLP